MHKIRHPNIVQLYGVVLELKMIMLVSYVCVLATHFYCIDRRYN